MRRGSKFGFFQNSVVRSLSSNVTGKSLLDSLKLGSALVSKGETKSAEKIYREIIARYPSDETAYRGLFGLWCMNRGVLGLQQDEIDWLKSEYLKNVAPDSSSKIIQTKR